MKQAIVCCTIHYARSFLTHAHFALFPVIIEVCLHVFSDIYIFISIDNHNMRSIYIILTVLPDCVINSANVCPSVCVYFCQSTIEHLGYKELTLDIQIYINMSFEISSYNVT